MALCIHHLSSVHSIQYDLFPSIHMTCPLLVVSSFLKYPLLQNSGMKYHSPSKHHSLSLYLCYFLKHLSPSDILSNKHFIYVVYYQSSTLECWAMREFYLFHSLLYLPKLKQCMLQIAMSQYSCRINIFYHSSLEHFSITVLIIL